MLNVCLLLSSLIWMHFEEPLLSVTALKMQRFPSTSFFFLKTCWCHVCVSYHGVCISLFFIEHKQYLLLKWEKKNMAVVCFIFPFSFFLGLFRLVQIVPDITCVEMCEYVENTFVKKKKNIKKIRFCFQKEMVNNVIANWNIFRCDDIVYRWWLILNRLLIFICNMRRRQRPLRREGTVIVLFWREALVWCILLLIGSFLWLTHALANCYRRSLSAADWLASM